MRSVPLSSRFGIDVIYIGIETADHLQFADLYPPDTARARRPAFEPSTTMRTYRALPQISAKTKSLVARAVVGLKSMILSTPPRT